MVPTQKNESNPMGQKPNSRLYEDDFEQLYPMQPGTTDRLKLALGQSALPASTRSVSMKPHGSRPVPPTAPATIEKTIIPQSALGHINPEFLMAPSQEMLKPRMQLAPLPENVQWDTLRAIVQQTVTVHFQNQQPVAQAANAEPTQQTSPPAQPKPEKPTLTVPSPTLNMSKEELLRWRPDQGFSLRPTQPSPKSKTPSPVLKPGQNAAQNSSQASASHWQFKPFSFQEHGPGVQSDSSQAPTPPLGAADRPDAMVTTGGHVSYHSSKSHHQLNSQADKGGNMVDLSGYKDLTKPPIASGDGHTATLMQEESTPMSTTESPYVAPDFAPRKNDEMEASHRHESVDIDSEYSGNVKTLVRLVNDLPEGVTKQTGAQIIRLTMEAMGISMESVLSEAQSAQSEMLDAVRANIKKIEEYKTIIRKLETEIRYHQGKANELSEIIDLFILSNASPKTAEVDHLMD